MSNTFLAWYRKQPRYLLLILVIITATYIFASHFPAPTSLSSYQTEQISSSFSRFQEENWLKLGLDQSDPFLVDIVKRKLLVPPPLLTEQEQNYSNYTFINEQGNNDRFEWVNKVLGTAPGFFIECGAHDGVYLSNTFRLEKSRKWTGLLVEPHPVSFQRLLKNKRNAWTINAALCVTPVASEVSFWIHSGNDSFNPALSSLNADTIKKWSSHNSFVQISVPCIPLYTILKAMDVSTVDYLSLDVEGSELGVLATLPFDKLQIKAMGIENAHVPGKVEALRSFLEAKEYRYAKDIDFDSLFVYKSIQLPAANTTS